MKKLKCELYFYTSFNEGLHSNERRKNGFECCRCSQGREDQCDVEDQELEGRRPVLDEGERNCRSETRRTHKGVQRGRQGSQVYSVQSGLLSGRSTKDGRLL